jgi:hypothetical protein
MGGVGMLGSEMPVLVFGGGGLGRWGVEGRRFLGGAAGRGPVVYFGIGR